ncbi:GTPase [uncultured Microbacterium sp.]|uniref:GTPase n=1 Tax=Microbacterium algeriense TaxID=2615184 RepID=UPI003390715C
MTGTPDPLPADAPKVDDTPFLEANETAKSRYGRFNLAVVGGTGVGKSSLINAVFGRDLAKVGKGLPVTRGADYYHDDSLGIWVSKASRSARPHLLPTRSGRTSRLSRSVPPSSRSPWSGIAFCRRPTV